MFGIEALSLSRRGSLVCFLNANVCKYFFVKKSLVAHLTSEVDAGGSIG